MAPPDTQSDITQPPNGHLSTTQSSDSPDMNDPNSSHHSLHPRPVLQYRKPGWRLRTFHFESKVRDYAIHKMRLVSLGQIMIGVICLGFSVAVIAVGAWGYHIGVGIWGGALFVLAGGIGIVAFLSLKLGFILATFLLSCASFLIGFVLFVVSCVGIEQDLNALKELRKEENYNSLLRIQGLESHIAQHKLKVAFNAVLLVVAVMELVVSLGHALMNGRHFFVWDEGCTSDSPYVYSNEGVEVEPDLPPTYHEAMGIPMAAASAPDYAGSDSGGCVLHPTHVNNAIAYYDSSQGSKYPGMDSPPVNTSFIEMRAGADWERQHEHQAPTSRNYPLCSNAAGSEHPTERSRHLPDHSQSPRSPPEKPPPLYSGEAPDSPLLSGGIQLGRGHPKDAKLADEPMYRRPQWPTPPIEEPIYANLQDYAKEKPYEEVESDQAPPRPPYPGKSRALPPPPTRDGRSYADSRLPEVDQETVRRSYDHDPKPSDHMRRAGYSSPQRSHPSELDYYRPDPSDLAYYRRNTGGRLDVELDAESHM